LNLFHLIFRIVLALSGDMARINQSTMKTVNTYQSESNVVKFNGTKNWKGDGDIGKSKTGDRED